MAKEHNSSPEAKAKLRLRLVKEMGGPAAVRVIESYSGPGTMRRLAYDGVADWLGMDSDPQSPDALHVDNRIAMRAIDMQRFNFFDLDAFGSPWQLVWLVSQRRKVAPGETIALAMTDGAALNLGVKLGPNLRAAGWSRQMAEAMQADPNAPARYFGTYAGAQSLAMQLVWRWFNACEPQLFLSAISQKKSAWYFGAILQGCHP